jgi:hypothetical protein
MKFVKGKLARLKVDKCFTTASGGRLKYPIISSVSDQEGWIYGTQVRTELDRWGTSYRLHRDRVYPILRVPHRGETRLVGSSNNRMLLVLDTESGHEVYVRKALMELMR